MKKQIISGIAIIACVTLCAVVWPRNAEVEDLPAEPIKSAEVAEIKARLEKTPEIMLSADTHILEPEIVAEYELERSDITTKKKRPYLRQRMEPNLRKLRRYPSSHEWEMFVS